MKRSCLQTESSCGLLLVVLSGRFCCNSSCLCEI